MEMYKHLGDKRTLDVIRGLRGELSNRSDFCKLLKSDPNACNHIPLGNGEFGICKKNPHHPDNVAARDALIAENPEIFSKELEERLESLGRESDILIEMGFANLTNLTPAQFLLAWHFRNERKAEEQTQQARIIINEYGKAMSK